MSDFNFGSLLGTSSNRGNVNQLLDDIRLKMTRTQELTKSYNKKYSDLAAFNKTLTDAYINNLNVIVDVSTLLNNYKIAMSQMLEELKKFDSVIVNDIDNTNIEHLKTLTDSSLENVRKFFQGEVNNIKGLFNTFKQTDAVNRISKASDTLGAIQRDAPTTYAGLKTGGKKKKVITAIGKRTQRKTRATTTVVTAAAKPSRKHASVGIKASKARRST